MSQDYSTKRTAAHTALTMPKTSQAKLTEDQVIQIKRLLEDGVLTKARIARDFGVDRSLIHSIGIGKKWRHVDA